MVEQGEELSDDSEEAIVLSVVMLVRDRWKLTQQSIVSLMRNTKEPVQLTIVDDASVEPVEKLISSLHSNVQIIRNDESKGTGWARNQGVEAARAKFGMSNLLYLSDNDVFFRPGWDTVLIDAHELNRHVKILGGGCHPYMQPHTQTPRLIHPAPYRVTTRDAVSGYSWLLSWETWDEFGPLDSHALGVRQGEDWAMCQKIVRDGYFVGSVMPEVVHHTGLFDTFKQRPPGWELLEKAKERGVLYE